MKKSINSKRAIIEHLRLKVRKLLKEEDGEYYADNPRWATDHHFTIPSDTVNLHAIMNTGSNPDGTISHSFTILDKGGNGVGPLNHSSWDGLGDTRVPPEGMLSDAADTITEHMAALHKAGHVLHVKDGSVIITDPKKISELLEPDGDMRETIYYRGGGPLEVHMKGTFNPEVHLDKYGDVHDNVYKEIENREKTIPPESHA